jgi:hypothetical protein
MIIFLKTSLEELMVKNSFMSLNKINDHLTWRNNHNYENQNKRFVGGGGSVCALRDEFDDIE